MDTIRGACTCFLLTAVGCVSPTAIDEPAPEDDVAAGRLEVEQTSFDFTLRADRELFAERDLTYVSGVGPYAIYRVTGPSPRLEGPMVPRIEEGTQAMLCGSQHYFGGDAAESVDMELRTGDRQQTLISLRMTSSSDCGSAGDVHSRPFVPPQNELGEFEQLEIHFDPAPAVDSMVLLRMVAVNLPDHEHTNDVAVGSVCCEGQNCALGGLPGQ